MILNRFIFAVLMLIAGNAIAQPVLTPENMALGGGGSTYITDFNSNFYNPANLFIKDKPTTVSFGLLTTGAYFSPVTSNFDLNSKYNDFIKYFNPYKENEFTVDIIDDNDFLNYNFPRKHLTSIHQARFESTLFGIHWKREKNAFSFAMRTRTASNFEVGRHWYSNALTRINEANHINRTLNHSFQTLHEISFGYAETLSLLNDLTPRLQNFIVGIAPKIVLAGPYQNAKWVNKYSKNDNEDYIYRKQHFEYDAIGSFSNATMDYLNGHNLQNVIGNNFSPIQDYLFDIHGFGAGVDVGLTYLLTLSNDLSTLKRDESETHSSIRVSLSVTDLGLISYLNNGISYEAQTDTTALTEFNTQANKELYIGSQGQYLSFVDKYGESNPFEEFDYKKSKFSVLLPTALHAGVLLELNRVKFSGDLNYALKNTAFYSNKLVTSLGLEIRPLKFLPIRGGIQLATEVPGYLSFGTGIETKHFNFSVATQLSINSNGDITPLTGLTLTALQFRL